MTTTKTLSVSDLRQFTGSENWHRHGLVPSVLLTDGAKYVADAGGAYWLLDEIALAQRYEKSVAAEEFQLWKLAVNLDQHNGVLNLRRRQWQHRWYEADSVHGFSAGGNQSVFLQQHHPVAERVLTDGRGRSAGAAHFSVSLPHSR